MNFLKNAYNKLFSQNPQSNQPVQIPETAQTIDQPEQQLIQIFQLTAKLLTESKVPTTDQTKLQLYGLYKQSTVGDCNTPKPALYQFVNKSKWDAWNGQKGISQSNAMKKYIALSVKADANIQKKMQALLQGQHFEEQEVVYNKHVEVENVGLKMVQQTDYSGSYSHPYFKMIEKGEDIAVIDHDLLLQVNNSPKVYPLHFAIDKEREDIVPRFLKLLSVQQILKMEDEEGTTILEYAQLIDNKEILQMIRHKLQKS